MNEQKKKIMLTKGHRGCYATENEMPEHAIVDRKCLPRLFRSHNAQVWMETIVCVLFPAIFCPAFCRRKHASVTFARDADEKDSHRHGSQHVHTM